MTIKMINRRTAATALAAGVASPLLAPLAGCATAAPPPAPSTMQVETAPGVRLHVQDAGGTGRPVVLIHGWPLSGEAFKMQTQPLVAAGLRPIAYDRRGFGRSSKPASGFDYDTLTADLHALIEKMGLRDVSLVGFSMGGGEVARYATNHGTQRLRSVVFAAAVPPYMMRTPDNPEGPLTPEKAKEMEDALRADREAFFDKFTRDFFSANGRLMVSEAQRQEAIALCRQSDPTAALACMKSFGTTDFRRDLPRVAVPALVLHGDADGIVPLPGSGQRTVRMVPNGRLAVVAGAPHGFNVSHADEFNRTLIAFLR